MAADVSQQHSRDSSRCAGREIVQHIAASVTAAKWLTVNPQIQPRYRKLRPGRFVAAPDFHALHSFIDGLAGIHKDFSSDFTELSHNIVADCVEECITLAEKRSVANSGLTGNRPPV